MPKVNINKPETLEEYKKIILGVRNYSSPKIFFYADDFSDWQNLLYFFHEIDSQEANLTEKGFHFLNDYYGFDYLFTRLTKESGHIFAKNQHGFIERLRSAILI